MPESYPSSRFDPQDDVPAAEAWQRCEVPLLPNQTDDENCNLLSDCVYDLVTHWTDSREKFGPVQGH